MMDRNFVKTPVFPFHRDRFRFSVLHGLIAIQGFSVVLHRVRHLCICYLNGHCSDENSKQQKRGNSPIHDGSSICNELIKSYANLN